MNKKVVITGGAGFIGSNTAEYFLQKGYQVTIIDNFSRKGSRENIKWLEKSFPKNLSVVTVEIKHETKKLQKAIEGAYLVIHLAAQVAVTTSVKNPREDLEINILGTFNVLEAVRSAKKKPILIYTSTNKVYGKLDGIPVKEKATRYEFKNLPYGISEKTPLDFYSPYGCSKGAADQYVRDYARIYGLKTIVFRQSCIYGPRQFGVEDQGWIAWFLIALSKNKKVTIYGNGKQVRDLLYIGDLVRAYELAAKRISITQGKIYNIGGGWKHTLSVWKQFHPILEKLFQRKITATFAKERPGDQHIFVSDIRLAKKDFGWKPTISVSTGLKKTFEWVMNNQPLFVNK